MGTNYYASLQKNNDNANGTKKTRVSSNLHGVYYLKRSKKVARNLP